jgi:hypothetical protein
MSHNKGFSDFTDKADVLGLALKGSFIILDGFLWLLNIHKGLGDHLEVFN